jgi:hypothetical protein
VRYRRRAFDFSGFAFSRWVRFLAIRLCAFATRVLLYNDVVVFAPLLRLGRFGIAKERKLSLLRVVVIDKPFWVGI